MEKIKIKAKWELEMYEEVGSKIMPYKDLSARGFKPLDYFAGHRSWYEEEKQEEWGTRSSHSREDFGVVCHFWTLLKSVQIRDPSRDPG